MKPQRNLLKKENNNNNDFCFDDKLVHEAKISPIQFSICNETDEPKRVSVFEIFNKNSEGIFHQNTVSSGTDIEHLKKFFYDTPHLSSLIRVQSSSLIESQAQNPFYIIRKTPMGNMEQSPAFILIDKLSKNQFQSGICDIPYAFLLDGLTDDLEFQLMPKTSIVITMFFGHKALERTKASISELNRIKQNLNSKLNNEQYIGSFVIENNSNEIKEVILVDKDKYVGDYMSDDSLRIYDMFSNGYKDLLDIYSCNERLFNSIVIFASGENKLKQIMSPIEFNSGNTYYPSVEVSGGQFQLGINELNIIGERLSCDNPLRVTVMPNTRVIYLFKKLEEVNYSSIKPSFYNIQAENLSNESKTIDLIGNNNDNKNVYHKIGKNKISINEENFSVNMMRVCFNDFEQIENPIILKSTDENGVISVYTVFPMSYVDEYNMIQNIINVPVPYFKLKNSQILIDLPKKGNGVNVILFNSVSITDYHKSKFVPISLENTTDELKTVELVNDITDFKEIAEGVILNDSYRELLHRIESQGNYMEMNLNKIYSNNSAQISQTLRLIDYTDPAKLTETIKEPIHYLSAAQFSSSMLNVGSFKIFDLKRIDTGIEVKVDGNGHEYNIPTSTVEKKQKLVFNILPKTKVYFLVTISKKSITLVNQDDDFTLAAVGLSK